MKTRIEPPVHVAWEITRRCNAQCVHCSANSGPEVHEPRECNTAEAVGIINQLADLGTRVLAFTGGEPLLRPDLPELIQHAVRRGLVTNVCTNGALLNESLALRLRESGLGSVTVSLDGACAATHDELRRWPGLFELAVEAIRTLVTHRHRVGISFTPTVRNCDEAVETVRLAYALGAGSVCISQFIPTGRGTRELMLDPGALGRVAREVLQLRESYARRVQVHCHDCHVALLLSPEEQAGYRGCGAGTATVGIKADGGVTPCIFMPEPVGHLQSAGLREIWENAPGLAALRDRDQLKEGNCGACRFKLVCGGCRAAALAIHGNPLAGDPSCWMFPEPTSLPEPDLVRN